MCSLLRQGMGALTRGLLLFLSRVKAIAFRLQLQEQRCHYQRQMALPRPAQEPDRIRKQALLAQAQAYGQALAQVLMQSLP